MSGVWAMVLAAGTSTRMKRQKMLLPYGQRTIIETVIHNIIPVLDGNILVVLGSHYYEIKKQISNLQVKTCFNEHYQQGMLSSVICGLNSIPEQCTAVLVYLGDQPQIPAEVAQKVIAAWKQANKGIVIPVFKGKRGHPVLIEIKYRHAIMHLDANKGLRQLMQDFKEDIYEVECDKPEILRDIDTPQDYKAETKKDFT